MIINRITIDVIILDLVVSMSCSIHSSAEPAEAVSRGSEGRIQEIVLLATFLRKVIGMMLSLLHCIVANNLIEALYTSIELDRRLQ